MELEVKKWGNSLGFRIPKDLARQLQVHDGTRLEVEVTDQGLLLKMKRRRSRLRVEDLLENIGPTEEVDWGEAQGQEVW